MSAPIITTIIPFDAILEYILSFSYTGFQVRKNRIIIKNNATNVTVFDETITSTLLKHTIPANILTNGTTYSVQIQVYDIDNNASPFSNTIVFSCLSTPLLSFSNLNNGDTVKESYINAQISYTQSEGELLNNYQVILYNYAKQEIYNSGTISGTILTTLISGLEDNSQYYIRAIGETVNHIPLDTGYVSFLCKYLKPSTFSFIEPKNNEKEASMSISSHIISIEGVINGTPIYIDNNMIDLTENGLKVVFDEAFSLSEDFTLHIQGKNFTSYTDFLILKNSQNNNIITLSWMNYLDSTRTPYKSYAKLSANGKLGLYTLFTERINIPSSTDIIHFWLRRVDNNYEFKIANKGGA
ncbi:MAG: hypothetical protein PHC75_08650 [Burkholderiales bacterium]|nr:hypothetical protein [Burkholderiales bacterium]